MLSWCGRARYSASIFGDEILRAIIEHRYRLDEQLALRSSRAAPEHSFTKDFYMYSRLAISGVCITMILLAYNISHAQTAPPAVWRCTSLDIQKCTDAQINDLELHMTHDWPALVILPMPNLPYSCSVQIDSCQHCLTGSASAQPAVAVTEQGTIPWSVTVTGAGAMNQFLIGSSIASAIISGEFKSSSDGVGWASTAINYVFQEAFDPMTKEPILVPAADGGTTGIADLGGLNLTTTAGSLWSSTFKFHFDFSDVFKVFSCTVGYPGHTITVASPAKIFDVNYPVSSTSIAGALESVVRNQFWLAARAVPNDPPLDSSN